MKEKENQFEVKSFLQGFNKGKQDTIQKVLRFVEDESKFIPDIHSDALLDRLVKFVKNL